MSLKNKLEKISKFNEDEKEKLESKLYIEQWKGFDLPNPFDVVKKFIKDKGLKLYGGLALHLYLKKHKKGLYKGSEFPDFDVQSPDAWNHAKELANLLYNMGFMFVEARSSVLNDYHHQTFKVSVDMIYIIDITQSGCTPKQKKNNDCKTCGQDKNGKCLMLFDDMPAVDSDFNKNTKEPTIYRKTYNYKTKKSYFPDKLFVMDKDWLKGQMYKELTQPLGNPSRLPKIGTRLQLFKKFYDSNHYKCSESEYKQIISKEMIPVLNFLGNYIRNKKFINYGATAYNFFIKSNKDIGTLSVSDYKVYSQNAIFNVNDLLEKLKKKFPKKKFNFIVKNKFWKEHEDVDYIVNVKIGNKYNNIITFTEVDKCIPYVQYNKIRYATIDRLKFLYYRSSSTPTFIKQVEDDSINYKCLLNNLIDTEKLFLKSKTTKGSHKFRRYVSKCYGDENSKIMQTLSQRWYNKTKTLKKSKYYINKPKGYITKVYKMSDEDLFMPYKPEEEKFKKKVY
tara:strand:+ start:1090 stop:2607 length:1518 start_codon:yes stop_codon:yes gene_type:complete